MRIGYVSAALTQITFANTPILTNLYSQSFYSLWQRYCGSLPAPKDPRVYNITVRNLLDSKSGLSDALIGYDPSFTGLSVDAQLPNILSNTMLAATPGSTKIICTFGFTILARLAVGVSNQTWLTLVRNCFPSGAPIYKASVNTPVPLNATPSAGAAEPSIYYLQSTDVPYDPTYMTGVDDLVSNIATLTWIGTQVCRHN